MGNNPVEVVGVVGHVRHWGLAGDDLSRIQDQVYYPLAEVPDRLVRLFSSIISLVIRTDVPPLNTIQALQQQARGAVGDQSLYEINTMEQLASGSLAQQRFLFLLFSIFSALALLLACVGIYSVLAYLMSQRVPEIGIRLAMGANSSDIVRLMLRPLPVPHPEQLAILAAQQKDAPLGVYFLSYSELLDFRKQADTFSDLFAYENTLDGMSADNRADHFVGSYVTGNYFSALQLKPALGRLLLPGEGEHVGAAPDIVLGYSYWQQRFGGSSNVIGKQVLVDGKPATIIGVAPKEFR